jgi:hypothetical protein
MYANLMLGYQPVRLVDLAVSDVKSLLSRLKARVFYLGISTWSDWPAYPGSYSFVNSLPRLSTAGSRRLAVTCSHDVVTDPRGSTRSIHRVAGAHQSFISTVKFLSTICDPSHADPSFPSSEERQSELKILFHLSYRTSQE